MIKGLSYIFFEDENGYDQVGFNRFNSPGYLDDGKGWTTEEHEEFQDIVGDLELEEVGSFIYEYQGTQADLENKLTSLGMKSQNPAWM
jgi:hypothetical protein